MGPIQGCGVRVVVLPRSPVGWMVGVSVIWAVWVNFGSGNKVPTIGVSCGSGVSISNGTGVGVGVLVGTEVEVGCGVGVRLASTGGGEVGDGVGDLLGVEV